MAYKIAITKQTKNVLTATDPNDFIFNSSYNTFKILAEGTLTDQTVSSDPTTFEYSHNQGQVPTFYGFALFPDGKMAGPLSSADYTTQEGEDDGYGYFIMEADSSKLYFEFGKNNGSYDVDIKWYIFEVPI